MADQSCRVVQLQVPNHFTFCWCPNMLDYTLQICTITASMCISTLAQSRPRSVSPRLHDCCLQVRTIICSKFISPNLVDDGLQLYLPTHPIMATKHPSKFPGLQPPSSHNHGLQLHLETCMKTILEFISKSTWSWPPSVSPNTLDYYFQVYIQTRSTTTPECISAFTRLSLSGNPWISLKHHQ